jgi:membrane protease YdiL (CAAX protease family)
MVPFTTTAIVRGVLHWAILAMMFGALASWIWVIHVRLSRRPLLPETPLVERRKPPWGIGTILLVLVAYVLVTRNALERYAHATRGGQPKAQAEAPVQVEKKAGEEPGPNGRHDEAESLPYGLSLTELMFVQAAINSILIVLLPAVVRLTSGARPRDLGLSLRHWTLQAATGIVAVLFLMPIVYTVQLLCIKYLDVPDPEQRRHPVERMIRETFSPGVAYLAFLTAVILAPLFEELLFRGIIQSWLVKAFDRFARWSRPSPTRWHAVPSPAGPEARDVPVATSDLADPYLVRSLVDDGGAETVYWEPDNEPPVVPEPQFAAGPDRVSLEEIVGAEKRGKPTARDAESPYRPRSPACTGAAIALTSLFFASLHAPQWPAPVPLFLLSVGLGLVYQRTGSLIAPICMHAIFNGFSTLTLFAMALEPPRDKPPARPVLGRVVPVEKEGVHVPNVGLERRHDKT